MATYDYSQLEELWIQAGGSRALAPLMAAIAMAESGGDSQAENPSGASGLWQILGNPFPGNVFDPLTNAKMAVAKYHSQGLGAWATYTSGAYKKFLQGSVPPSAQLTVTTPGQQQGQQGLFNWFNLAVPGFAVPFQFLSGSASTIGDVGDAVGEIGKSIAEVVTWVSWLFIPNHWIRIICFMLGVPLVGIGVTVMVVGSHPIPVSVGAVSTQVSGGSIAPAMGIAEVTVGSILLFIAFHNLPDSVKTFPQLLSHLQSQVQTGVTSKEGPGPRPPVI